MSEWTHPICEEDFEQIRPGVTPSKLIHRFNERCCWCGEWTLSGIYIRWDPRDLPNHEEHDPPDE